MGFAVQLAKPIQLSWSCNFQSHAALHLTEECCLPMFSLASDPPSKSTRAAGPFLSSLRLFIKRSLIEIYDLITVIEHPEKEVASG